MARSPDKRDPDAAPPWPAPGRNEDLVGQEEAEKVLLDAFGSGRLPHAWLLTGPRGVGKATLAHRFARFLLAGEHGGGLFGGGPTSLATDMRSPVAQRVASGGHADLRVVARSVNQKTGKLRTEIIVDDIRDLGGFMRMTPAEGGWRVAIIDAADEMNRSAANAVLKVLEEPPRRSVLLLVAHAPGRLLPTIRSRCRKLALRALPEARVVELMGRLAPETDPAERAALARLADGSAGRALELGRAGGLALYRDMVGVIAGLPRLDIGAAHAFAERIGRRGADGDSDFRTVAFLLDWWLQTLVREGSCGTAEPIVVEREEGLRARLFAAGGLDRLMQVWEKSARSFARSDGINLDRKQVVLLSLLDLQSAVHRA
ncbi:MAG: DNA polymerase III subunit delta' [Rhodospirillales bacterium]|nr:MAG: DNA polymerase III subunit delta' [Rhodospirillales bacterium]